MVFNSAVLGRNHRMCPSLSLASGQTLIIHYTTPMPQATSNAKKKRKEILLLPRCIIIHNLLISFSFAMVQASEVVQGFTGSYQGSSNQSEIVLYCCGPGPLLYYFFQIGTDLGLWSSILLYLEETTECAPPSH